MNTPSNNDVPTPDSLRISRLDRLLDQLGEHQLTIRQHVSICATTICKFIIE